MTPIICSACNTENDPSNVYCEVCHQPLQMTIVAQKPQLVALAAMSTPSATGMPTSNTVTKLIPLDPIGNLANPEINLPQAPYQRLLGWINANAAPPSTPVIDIYRLYRDWISVPDPNGNGRLVGISRGSVLIFRLEAGPVFVRALEGMNSKLWIMYPGENAIEILPGDEYPLTPGASIFFGIHSVGMTLIAQ